MDSDAREQIAEEVVPRVSGGSETFEEAVNNVLSRNESLDKSKTWDTATDKQIAQLRERVTSDKRTDKFTVTKSNQHESKEFIQVDKNNFKRVLRNKDYAENPETGQIWLRDSKGQWRELINE